MDTKQQENTQYSLTSKNSGGSWYVADPRTDTGANDRPDEHYICVLDSAGRSEMLIGGNTREVISSLLGYMEQRGVVTLHGPRAPELIELLMKETTDRLTVISL